MIRLDDHKIEYVFCTEYKHYRTGKIMRAKDYGYEYWRLPIKRYKK